MPHELLERIHPDDRDQAPTGSARRTGLSDPSSGSAWRTAPTAGAATADASRSKNGQRNRIVGAIIDIHDEKVMLEQLAQNAERLALAEDVAGFGVWESDVATSDR